MKTARIVFSSTVTAPLYLKYPTDCNPQPAYVSLDIENGEVDADVSGEVGYGMPAAAWHGVVRRYRINNELSASQVTDLLTELLPVFQRVLDGAEKQWDGDNWVGVLNDDARAAEDEVERDCPLGHDIESNLIIDLKEWLTNGGRQCWMPAPDVNIEQYIQEFDLDGRVALDGVRETLIALWADELYSGEHLNCNVATFLLDSGYCDNSAWLDELNAYAGLPQPQ